MASSNVPTFEQFFTLPSEEEFTAIALEGANIEGINETLSQFFDFAPYFLQHLPEKAVHHGYISITQSMGA